MVAHHLGIPSRVAVRYEQSEGTRELTSGLTKARVELSKWQVWSRGFEDTLREADREGLPSGYVWQRDWVDYWEPFDPIERRLLGMLTDLEGLGVDFPHLVPYVDEAVSYLDPPLGGRIEDAIKRPKFGTHPSTGRSEIIYEERLLRSWHLLFTRWLDAAIQGVDSLIEKL